MKHRLIQVEIFNHILELRFQIKQTPLFRHKMTIFHHS